MAPNEVRPGPIAKNVIENVHAIRRREGLTLVGLAQRLEEIGHPILSTGLQRLEAGKRRVDPDDLIGLACALGVSPVSLLLPHVDDGEVQVTGKIKTSAQVAWDWIRARGPLFNHLDKATWADFQTRSLPVNQRKYALSTEEGQLAFARDHPEVMVRRVEELQRLQRERGEPSEHHEAP